MGNAVWTAASAAQEFFTACSTPEQVEAQIRFRAGLANELGQEPFGAETGEVIRQVLGIIKSGTLRKASRSDMREIGIPHRFTDKTFENFEGIENLNRKIGRLSTWPLVWSEEKSHWTTAQTSMALIFGPTGVGKTHISAASARNFWQANIRPCWISANSWFSQMKDSIEDGGYGERLAIAKTVPYLVIDELVLEALTDWSRSIVSETLCSRYDASLPTMITTNNNPEDFGRIDQRVASRLLGHDALLVPLSGKDRRAPALTPEGVLRRLEGK